MISTVVGLIAAEYCIGIVFVNTALHTAFSVGRALGMQRWADLYYYKPHNTDILTL